MKPTATIIIDSREQEPLAFEHLPTEVGTLDTGDYSVRGLEHLIALERKSIDDLLTCCGRERDRFKRELQRLRAYRYRLLLIEADAATLECGDWRSALTPAHVLGSLAAWTVQYALPIWLAGDHAAAGRFAERWLFQCARTIRADYGAAVPVSGRLTGAAGACRLTQFGPLGSTWRVAVIANPYPAPLRRSWAPWLRPWTGRRGAHNADRNAGGGRRAEAAGGEGR